MSLSGEGVIDELRVFVLAVPDGSKTSTVWNNRPLNRQSYSLPAKAGQWHQLQAMLWRPRRPRAWLRTYSGTMCQELPGGTIIFTYGSVCSGIYVHTCTLVKLLLLSDSAIARYYHRIMSLISQDLFLNFIDKSKKIPRQIFVDNRSIIIPAEE